MREKMSAIVLPLVWYERKKSHLKEEKNSCQSLRRQKMSIYVFEDTSMNCQIVDDFCGRKIFNEWFRMNGLSIDEERFTTMLESQIYNHTGGRQIFSEVASPWPQHLALQWPLPAPTRGRPRTGRGCHLHGVHSSSPMRTPMLCWRHGCGRRSELPPGAPWMSPRVWPGIERFVLWP